MGDGGEVFNCQSLSCGPAAKLNGLEKREMGDALCEHEYANFHSNILSTSLGSKNFFLQNTD